MLALRQHEPVEVYVIASDAEGAVVASLQRTGRPTPRSAASMVEAMADVSRAAVRGSGEPAKKDAPTARVVIPSWMKSSGGTVMDVLNQEVTPSFAAYHVDCVGASEPCPITPRTTDLSPPFASLYTYTNSPRDRLGNVKDDEEFFAHFGLRS